MRKVLLLVILLAGGCRQGSGDAANRIAETRENQAVPAQPAAPVQTATLTGLYEGAGPNPSQLCITGQGRAARFGLVTRRAGRPGCSGAGAATRSGATLSLVMDGDSSCAIAARIDGTRVTFPASLPRGCSYYCAPGAVAGSAAFTKTGGTRADALRARDIVGDPLCS
jgi:hypothetical protein